MMFLNRYCTSLRAGLETPADVTSTTAKEYEDGMTVRGDTAADETIAKTDTIFFVHLGARY